VQGDQIRPPAPPVGEETMGQFLQQLINGIQIGSIYALIAYQLT